MPEHCCVPTHATNPYPTLFAYAPPQLLPLQLLLLVSRPWCREHLLLQTPLLPPRLPTLKAKTADALVDRCRCRSCCSSRTSSPRATSTSWHSAFVYYQRLIFLFVGFAEESWRRIRGPRPRCAVASTSCADRVMDRQTDSDSSRLVSAPPPSFAAGFVARVVTYNAVRTRTRLLSPCTPSLDHGVCMV